MWEEHFTTIRLYSLVAVVYETVAKRSSTYAMIALMNFVNG